MGECWHNNHHAYPGSARLGLFAGEWDPGWWVLIALREFGLAWNLRLPSDLPPRPELIQLPHETAPPEEHHARRKHLPCLCQRLQADRAALL